MAEPIEATQMAMSTSVCPVLEQLEDPGVILDFDVPQYLTMIDSLQASLDLLPGIHFAVLNQAHATARKTAMSWFLLALSSSNHTPHNGLDARLAIPGRLMDAALTAKLQLPANGIPQLGNLRDHPTASVPSKIAIAVDAVKIMASGLKPQLAIATGDTNCPLASQLATTARKIACDRSQCSNPEINISGSAMRYGNCKKYVLRCFPLALLTRSGLRSEA